MAMTKFGWAKWPIMEVYRNNDAKKKKKPVFRDDLWTLLFTVSFSVYLPTPRQSDESSDSRKKKLNPLWQNSLKFPFSARFWHVLYLRLEQNVLLSVFPLFSVETSRRKLNILMDLFCHNPVLLFLQSSPILIYLLSLQWLVPGPILGRSHVCATSADSVDRN